MHAHTDKYVYVCMPLWVSNSMEVTKPKSLIPRIIFTQTNPLYKKQINKKIVTPSIEQENGTVDQKNTQNCLSHQELQSTCPRDEL